MKQTIDRIYNLLQKKPILTIAALFHPIASLLKLPKRDEEQIVGKV